MMALWMILSQFWSSIAKILLHFVELGIPVEPVKWTRRTLTNQTVRYIHMHY